MICQSAKAPKMKPFSYSKAQAIAGNTTFGVYLRPEKAGSGREKNRRMNLPDGKKYKFHKTHLSKICQ